jgi:hypothetical protein
MALTTKVRLKLEEKGFPALYADNVPEWQQMADKARTLIGDEIQNGEPTIDDIKKTLMPMMEINPRLRDFLAEKGLRQLYWTSDFVDYVLHRIYEPQLKAMGG